MAGPPADEFERTKTQVVTRLRLSDPALKAVRAQLDQGWVFLPTDEPAPPGTLLAFMLQDERGHLVHSGQGEVVAWRTLLTDPESDDPSGMRIRVDNLDGHELAKASAAQITAAELTDASEILAGRIDLDAEDEPVEPVPLPSPGRTPAAEIDFTDLASLLGEQGDLEGIEAAEPPAPVEVEPSRPAARPPRPTPSRARRRDARATCSIQVRAHQVPLGKPFEAVAWNLSAGGLFLRTSQLVPLMGLLQLELSLPGLAEPVHQAAKVVRVQPPAEHGESPRMAGLGVQFIDPSDELRQRIEALVGSYRVRPRELEVENEAAAEAVAAIGPEPEPAAVAEPEPEAEAAERPDLEAPVAAEPEAPEALSAAEQKKLVVNALVAALNLSGVEEFQDNETIAYLLKVWFPKYFQDGTVDLTLLWNTLAADEGIDAVQAALPLFIFALSRDVHGLAAKLPEGLSHFDRCGETLERARHRLAGPGTFRRAYERVAEQAAEAARAKRAERVRAPTERQRKVKKSRAEKLAPWPRRPSRKPKADRPLVTPVRLVVAAVALAACIASYFIIRPDRAEFVDPTAFSGALQIDSIRVQDEHLQAVIRDARWEDMAPQRRRSALLELLTELEGKGIRSALLFDRNLKVAAVVRSAPDVHLQPVVRVGAEVLFKPAGESD